MSLSGFLQDPSPSSSAQKRAPCSLVNYEGNRVDGVSLLEKCHSVPLCPETCMIIRSSFNAVISATVPATGHTHFLLSLNIFGSEHVQSLTLEIFRCKGATLVCTAAQKLLHKLQSINPNHFKGHTTSQFCWKSGDIRLPFT